MSLEHALFYKSIDGDRVYDDTSFEHWLKKFFTSGVFLNDFQVTSNGNMSVNVGAGYVNADGKVKIYQADTTLNIETAGATYPRIDSIVLERNDTERDIFLKVVKGGYSSEPVAHVPVRQDGVYQLVIAQILVNAGAVKIAQADITDTRSNMNLCGFVAGAVKQIDFSQIQAQFEEYLAYYEEYIADYATHMQEDFEAWFDNIKGQLSEDAAGHLQVQIDEMKEDLENVGGSRVEVAVDDNDGEYNVVGLIVKLEIDGQTYTKKVPSEKKVVFQVLEIGTATISCADGAQDYEATASIEIPCYSAYGATLGGGSGFDAWIEAGGYTKAQYPDVESVLADEKAVRKLMTVHASCDAFVNWYKNKNKMISQFTANRVAMKWIGLRDYITDKLMAIPSASEQLLASEHWEYILKDKAPVMTSNTAPEGTCFSQKAETGGEAYLAFDQSETTMWKTGVSQTIENTYIGYTFANPIVVKKVVVKFDSNVVSQKFRIQASNNGVDWDDLTSDITSIETEQHFVVECSKAYMKYRLYFYVQTVVSGNNTGRVCLLQFYGRSLNESIPVMTSNTAPLGEATANSNATNTFRVFDGDDSSMYLPVDKTLVSDFFVQYKFAKAILPKKANLIISCGKTSVIQIVASVDGNAWEPISDEITITSDTSMRSVELNANKSYLYVRIKCVSIEGSTYAHVSNSYALTLSTFQCYGASYSEEEFGSDGIEMLYDNGVEIATLTNYTEKNSEVVKHDDYATVISKASTSYTGGLACVVEYAGDKTRTVVEYDEKTSSTTNVRVNVSGIGVTSTNAETNTNVSSESKTSGKVVLDTSAISKSATVVAEMYDASKNNVELAKIRKWYMLKA